MHKGGDCLDRKTGELEASIQGCINPAKIIVMEELPLMSEFWEVKSWSKSVFSVPGKCISGSTLFSASLFPPLLRLYWSTLSSSKMPKSVSLPRGSLVCGYTAWAALPKSLLKYSHLDHKYSCMCEFELAVLLIHVGGFQHCLPWFVINMILLHSKPQDSTANWNISEK